MVTSPSPNRPLGTPTHAHSLAHPHSPTHSLILTRRTDKNRYLSSFCLTALLATAAGPLALQPPEDYIWSQAVWYGMWAAALYFFVAALMSVTAYGALKSHYPLDFQLTTSQRTLMLQTIMLLLYILLGALVFSNLEGWAYLDSVYWANVTLFTIGFGDIVVTSSAGRALLIPYALVGIVSVGLVITSIRSLVIERASRRVDARLVEKKRRRVVAAMLKQGKDSVLRPIRPSPPCPDGQECDPDCQECDLADRDGTALSELARREAEFNLMRLIQHEALVRRRWVATVVSIVPWLVLWLVGALIFVKFEESYQQWSYFEGVYFAFVSLTTLGYGDLTPVTNGARSFFVFWALLALPTMTVLISNAEDTFVGAIRDVTLELGRITILPGEHGFEMDVRFALHKLSCGLLFARKFSVGELASVGAPRDVRGEGDGEATGREESPESQVPKTQLPRPASSAEYHYLLISAISTISCEMKATPKKRYPFHEWAYYLYLVGEDERSPETHRMARLKQPGPLHAHPHPHLHPSAHSRPHSHTDSLDHVHSHHHLHRQGPLLRESKRLRAKIKRRPRLDEVEEEAEGERWSWVGNQSPLIGGEESEWILSRLTARLREELEGVLMTAERA